MFDLMLFELLNISTIVYISKGCLLPNVVFRIKIISQGLPTVKKRSYGLQFIRIKL